MSNIAITPSLLLTSAPIDVPLAHAGTKDGAIALLKQYGIESFYCIEAKNLAGYIRARYDMMDGYRFSALDHLKRMLGFRKRWPLVGLVVTDAVIEDDEDLIDAVARARMTRSKVVFIGELNGRRIKSELHVLKTIS